MDGLMDTRMNGWVDGSDHKSINNCSHGRDDKNTLRGDKVGAIGAAIGRPQMPDALQCLVH